MEIFGTVTSVLAAQSGTSQRGTAWMSQEFVIEVPNGQYTKHVCFKLFGEQRIGNAAPLLVPGSSVKVSFDIDAHEYNGRWYNSIDAWKIEPAVQQNFQAAAPATYTQPAPVAPTTAPAAVPPPAASAIPAPQPNQQGSELPF